ncbi:hypothetical protein [uncultured Sphingomonas sp.]|uniref:hypothetical protein n=1 Tax=uncultured Sphingomonas sp. TaxID=158754 RepID=UPI0025F233AA|nr:hypothetical protein [uncultured Sphingomonas sp.]
MSNLRAGAVYGAARVPPTTARTWALELGESRPGGHPRYDITDVVMLIMMQRLTVDRSMAAAPAAIIVNALRPYLPDMIAKIDREWAEHKELRPGGPYAVIHGQPSQQDPIHWMAMVFADEVIKLQDDQFGMVPLILRLRPIIALSIHRLERVLSGEVEEWNDAAGDTLASLSRRALD